jgi:hypothetical protein
MKALRVLGISCVFVVGCAVGGAASRFVVPPANAQVVSPRWQHFCFEENDVDRTQQKASRAGMEGWEMVAGQYFTWCFKRAIR